MLGIEIINQCNFSCYFCAAGYKKQELQMLSLNDIITLSEDIIKLGISFIKLTPSRGEIFIHPEIYEILSLLSNIETIKQIYFHTNFEMVNFNLLLTSNIKIEKLKIFVSHYGFNGVEEFIFQTNKSKQEYYNVENNIKKAKEIGIDFNISPRTRNYNYDCPNQKRKVYDKPNGVCSNSFVPRIVANGDFIYCTCSPDSSFLDDRYIIGNIKMTSLLDLYLHQKRYNFYLKMRNNIIPDICEECTTFNITTYKPTISCIKNLSKMKNMYDSKNT